MKLRWGGDCATCGVHMDQGTQAYWDATARVVYCLAHAPMPLSASASDVPSCPAAVGEQHAPRPVDRGEAGRSAQREHDRRMARREQKVRTKHPIIGGALLAAFGDPQTTKAWDHGATGERVVGRRLDSLADRGVIALHDRRVPGSRANIDHIVVGPSGVYVVDAKYRESGRIRLRNSGTLFRPGPPLLYVGNRNETPLVAKMAGQLAVVMAALDGLPQALGVPIHPVLAFVNVDWGLFPRIIEISGVLVLWPKDLAKRAALSGPVSAACVQALSERIAERLKPA